MAEFAAALRRLQDAAGARTRSVGEIGARTGIPRSTLYAALRGDRLPRREVVAALAREWGGDEARWLAKRAEIEQALTMVPVQPPVSGHAVTFTRDVLALWHENSTRREYRRGDTLAVEGDPGTTVQLVDRGFVKISKTGSGLTVTHGFRGPGTLVGETAAMASLRSSTTATAVTEVAASVLTSSRFLDLVAANRALASQVMRALAVHVLAQEDGRHSAAAKTGKDRLLEILRDLADNWGQPADDGSILIPIPLTQQDLAHMADLSLSSTARALAEFRQRGLVKTGYHHLRMLPVPHGGTGADE
ncbi:cyclic nucleotide-binding domain-containing protein [Actinokineospora diospyrosa]|uniref:cyclic nucleotide-binding domain-containing protein n=1 Tax=Actinokineospora diospyrosa TaxID=103728 RepID=UPI0020A50102|nr:cyclic nucleotide-binding domain-containing protein [Actinokineospora diospyrosa]